MVIIDASQALDPGSIPGRRIFASASWPRIATALHFYFFILLRCLLFFLADIAQLGERQTEDLKVPGSIPGVGTCSGSSVGRAWV